MLSIKGRIGVLTSARNQQGEDIVTAAFIRSFSRSQVYRVKAWSDMEPSTQCLVLINPCDCDYEHLKDRLAAGLKLILFGTLADCWAEFLGVETHAFPVESAVGNTVVKEESGVFSHSLWKIAYRFHDLTSQVPYQERYLSRYDFTDEWNNHGYGRIGVQGDPLYAIAQCVQCKVSDEELGWIENEFGEKIGSYCTVHDSKNGSVLWVNRAVGPVDSLEWTIIEQYLSCYRSAEFFSFPYLLEVPAGFTGVCTMRLDCDQAIAAARPLFELYCQEEIPFSLAVLTGLPMDQADWDLIHDVVASGGAIVTHSVNHQPDWGGSYEVALKEALESKWWLENAVPATNVNRYLVSPFHQNPRYAVKAMADAGYAGFIGGIIHNDPDYLLARSGVVPYMGDSDFFSLSQQCMLHGDCFHNYGNSIAPYLETFRFHHSCQSIFGYLDHPFSSEYQYGWLTESERLAAHRELIREMKSVDGIWFCNLNACLDFCHKRARTQVWVDPKGILQWSGQGSEKMTLAVQARWQNEIHSLCAK